MKKRLTYEAPEGELILVRFEETILSGRDLQFDSSNPNAPGSLDSDSIYDGGSF